MGLETGTYPTFVGGVSQQDDSVRHPSQLSTAINSWLHAAMGNGKRPGAEFVKVLASDISDMACFHSIVRDGAERYLVVIESGKLRVFNHETGYEYDVVPTGAALEYLQTESQPWSVFRCATMADTTFITNIERRVEMDAELSPGTITGSVQTFADLPKPGSHTSVPNGVIYEIAGADGSETDNYYVQRSGAGVWLEVARPGIKHKFNRRTMPHVLKRIPDPVHGDGFYFSFGAPEWGVRLAGDAKTNLEPSFVGESIADVFFHRGRLGLLSTENCALSEIDHELNFWRTSVTQLLDSDPVDFAVNTDGVATLRHGISFESALLLFGDRANFQMTADPFLTPRTPKVNPLVNYECSPYVSPVLLGDSLYYASDSGRFTLIREYFVDDVSITGDAANVTSHVPRYIPGGVRAMESSPDADVLFVAPRDSQSQLYAYFVRWAGNDKQQSAWCEWDLAGVGKVVHMKSIGDHLYVVAQEPSGGVEMLRISLSLATHEADFVADTTFLLDRLVVVEPVHQEFGNYTVIDMPYVIEDLADVSVVQTDDWDAPGVLVDLRGADLQNGGTRIRVPGNVAEGRVAVGLNYTHVIEPSRPYLRDNNGNAILVGRLQVRDIEIAYRDGAFFEVEVHTNGRAAAPQRFLCGHHGLFTARTLSDSEFTLGAPIFHSGNRRFPVLSRSDQLRLRFVNRLPYQCWFQSAQYRALFTTRSRV